ncbi:hypothetical protein GCM10009557_58010 [Virgisporangium ochraceum]|uniref:Uncharacterized protein n=1 Tax=Virgisporangium ochraceum TaxID=65505 RepID=A0A8J4A1I0_9ACTN|nr:hypothetical protein Voc01_060680 [Virgisporangium ochraceum]
MIHAAMVIQGRRALAVPRRRVKESMASIVRRPSRAVSRREAGLRLRLQTGDRRARLRPAADDAATDLA